MVVIQIYKAHVFGCKFNYVNHVEITKSFQELYVVFGGGGELLAAIKGVSSKFLNAYIILSGLLPVGHLELVCF